MSQLTIFQNIYIPPQFKYFIVKNVLLLWMGITKVYGVKHNEFSGGYNWLYIFLHFDEWFRIQRDIISSHVARWQNYYHHDVDLMNFLINFVDYAFTKMKFSSSCAQWIKIERHYGVMRFILKFLSKKIFLLIFWRIFQFSLIFLKKICI